MAQVSYVLLRPDKGEHLISNTKFLKQQQTAWNSREALCAFCLATHHQWAEIGGGEGGNSFSFTHISKTPDLTRICYFQCSNNILAVLFAAEESAVYERLPRHLIQIFQTSLERSSSKLYDDALKSAIRELGSEILRDLDTGCISLVVEVKCTAGVFPFLIWDTHLKEEDGEPFEIRENVDSNTVVARFQREIGDRQRDFVDALLPVLSQIKYCRF